MVMYVFIGNALFVRDIISIQFDNRHNICVTNFKNLFDEIIIYKKQV